ncbi:MAG: hypothetical protein WC475_04150 [Candidatus Paceibacterota bacterium]
MAKNLTKKLKMELLGKAIRTKSCANLCELMIYTPKTVQKMISMGLEISPSNELRGLRANYGKNKLYAILIDGKSGDEKYWGFWKDPNKWMGYIKHELDKIMSE